MCGTADCTVIQQYSSAAEARTGNQHQQATVPYGYDPERTNDITTKEDDDAVRCRVRLHSSTAEARTGNQHQQAIVPCDPEWINDIITKEDDDVTMMSS